MANMLKIINSYLLQTVQTEHDKLSERHVKYLLQHRTLLYTLYEKEIQLHA